MPRVVRTRVIGRSGYCAERVGVGFRQLGDQLPSAFDPCRGYFPGLRRPWAEITTVGVIRVR